MSKRDGDGDVIANRISLLEAKGQKLLASLYGSDWDSARDSATKPQDEDDDADLKQNYAHDRAGLGYILPKDVEDGSFTRRIPTSDDKLLQQLIGKRAAKAHLAAKQEAARPNASAKAQGYVKPPPAKKEESEDEEEGRAATFKSKRQKKGRKAVKKMDSDDEDEETRAKRLAASKADEEETTGETATAPVQVEEVQSKEQVEEEESIQPAPKRAKTKPKSFLDELLAERSQKKSRKGKA